MSPRAPADSSPPTTVKTLVETSRVLPLVSITVALRGGAAFDPEGREGCARFAARLMRRTAGGLDPHTLDVQIDSMGAALSVDSSHSSLAFQGVVLRRSLRPFVQLIADALGRPVLDGDEFERLRRESQSELVEVLDNDRALAQRWLQRALFRGDPYGRAVAGTQASLARLASPDVRAFHRQQIGRENLVVAFAGDLTDDQAGSAAEVIAAAIPQGARVDETSADPPPRPGRHLLVVDKPDRSQTQIMIGTLGTRADDPDHTAMQVANTIFGGTFGARLAREIRVERGWSYGAYSSLTIDRRRHAFTLWTFPKAEDAAPCIRHQLGMAQRWVDDGVTDAELAQAQAHLVRSHVFAIDTAAKRVGLALDEEIYGLPPNYYEGYPARVKALTRGEVNAAIRQRIRLEDLVVVVVGTASTIIDEVRRAIDDLESTEIVPFDADP